MIKAWTYDTYTIITKDGEQIDVLTDVTDMTDEEAQRIYG